MSEEAGFPLNDLPQELQREIYVAAVREHPPSALRIVRVAKKVYNWYVVLSSVSQMSFRLMRSTVYAY